MYCEICKKEVGVLGRHLCRKHKDLNPKDYYDKFLKKPGEGICPVCGKETTFWKLSYGYSVCCSRLCNCQYENTIDKRKNTLLKNYGVDSPLKSKEIKEKVFTKEYSDLMSNILKEAFSKCSDEVWKKRTKKFHKNLQEKYGEGIINVSQIQEIKLKIRKSYRLNGVRKNCYIFDEKIFDSSWELAYYIWLKDNNIEFEYHPDIFFEYTIQNKKHHYFPDFKVGDNFVEIKGDAFLNEGKWKMTDEKLNCIKQNTIMLTRKEITPILYYIKNKYGKHYLKQFKQKNNNEK
jgi:hypothetical protein